MRGHWPRGDVERVTRGPSGFRVAYCLLHLLLNSSDVVLGVVYVLVDTREIEFKFAVVASHLGIVSV